MFCNLALKNHFILSFLFFFKLMFQKYRFVVAIWPLKTLKKKVFAYFNLRFKMVFLLFEFHPLKPIILVSPGSAGVKSGGSLVLKKVL